MFATARYNVMYNDLARQSHGRVICHRRPFADSVVRERLRTTDRRECRELYWIEREAERESINTFDSETRVELPLKILRFLSNVEMKFAIGRFRYKFVSPHATNKNSESECSIVIGR